MFYKRAFHKLCRQKAMFDDNTEGVFIKRQRSMKNWNYDCCCTFLCDYSPFLFPYFQ